MIKRERRIDRSAFKTGGSIWKPLLTATLFIPLNFYWIIVGETGLVGYALNTYAVPFYNVIFSLLLLISVNSLFEKVFNRTFFTSSELLSFYTFLSMACALPSITFMTLLVTTLGHPFYYATPENEWQELFLDKLPRWLFVADRDVLKGYYEGDSTLYTMGHIRAWITPIIHWTIFTGFLGLVMLCLNLIFREQWVKRERLSYPIAQLAYRICTDQRKLFSDKAVMLGFSISASIDLINGLSFLYPVIPSIPVKRIGGWRGFGHLFTEKPWSAIGPISMSFYPFVIGLGFLMPLDLAFSSWFFFIFHKMELVASCAVGINVRGFPFYDEQCFGAAIGIFLFLLIRGRRYLIETFRSVYKLSTLGLILGLAYLTFFSIRIGMSPWLIPLLFGFHLIILIFITRMRAELGFPVHAMENMSPHNVIVRLIGTRALGKDNLIAISIYRWFNRSFTSNPMPHQMEGFKLADMAGIDVRKLSLGIMSMIVLGSLATFWMILHLFYKFGAVRGGGWATGFGWRVFNGLQRWLYYPSSPGYGPAMGVLWGFLFSVILMILRSRFFWWPLHPLGFVISSDWGMRYLWSCMLISSTVKWLVLRFGGRKASHRLYSFAIGLILGDFTVGGIWSLLGVAIGKPMYNFWP
ncbi:hypothetical protein J7M22_01735 [Candidatus Poribacteria bacterium]|nr:hypothetical protein [Candidatus Poribacteria bacterium]